MIIDGSALASTIKEKVKTQISTLNFSPQLGVILVGENWESKLYIKQKQKACQEVGIQLILHQFPVDVSQQEIITLIQQLNNDTVVTGIIVQLPFPKEANSDLLAIQRAIDPWKDVDGFNPINRGLLFLSPEKLPEHVMVPCTPLGCIQLLESIDVDLTGKHAVVLGRSNLVGRPLAHLLLQKNMTVTMCHSKTRDVAFHTKQADLIVAAIGSPKFVKEGMVKSGAIVLDVGINRTDDGITGDVDFEHVQNVASFITPVPRGVGPMTVACLLENVMKAAISMKHS